MWKNGVVCENNHCLCRPCFDQYKIQQRSLNCPICRVALDDIQRRTSIFESMVGCLEIKCPLQLRGAKRPRVNTSHTQCKCKWTGKLSDLQRHYDDTHAATLDCPNKCCKDEDVIVLYNRTELQEHLKVCQNQEIPCTYCTEGCNFKALRSEMTAHVNNIALHGNFIIKKLENVTNKFNLIYNELSIRSQTVGIDDVCITFEYGRDNNLMLTGRSERKEIAGYFISISCEGHGQLTLASDGSFIESKLSIWLCVERNSDKDPDAAISFASGQLGDYALSIISCSMRGITHFGNTNSNKWRSGRLEARVHYIGSLSDSNSSSSSSSSSDVIINSGSLFENISSGHSSSVAKFIFNIPLAVMIAKL
jgi:hypothetical protein